MANNWIPVKYGLPKEAGYYAINEPGFYSYDRDWGYVMEHSITHWMPLPGEPEE